MHLGGPLGLFDWPNVYCLTSYEHSRSKWVEEEEKDEEKVLKNCQKEAGRTLYLPRVIKNWFTTTSLKAKSSISLALPRGFSGGLFLAPIPVMNG